MMKKKRREQAAILREIDRMSEGKKEFDTTDLPPKWISHLGNLQRKLEEDEAERNRIEARSRLEVASVLHDLKTPAAVIMGAVECIREGMDDKDYLEMISERAEAINTFALHLAETAKQEAQDLLTEKEDVDSRKFFKTEFERYRSLAETKGIRYKIGRLPKVKVSLDIAKMSRVVQNLISNAAKYSEPGTRIKIRGDLSGKFLRFDVIDHGKGIKKENLAFVFDKFYMEDASRASGSGLGLYVTKQIIQEHGGKIWVKSRVGRGSKFSFTLPMARIRTKYFTDRFENMSVLDKVMIQLFFGWIWGWLFRVIRFSETRCGSTLWGAFFAIVFMPFVWIIDIISLIFYKQLTFLTE